ncbi:hypothetical protein Aph02nite_03180 [Actinoplanes philippinensis]|uniref:DUF7824 domain-containing protein n=1 Tax=Actinoplanes philippinensis TaxID=35752 RepID=A0A1I2DA98_9ACTN|nr:DUF6493 family protein [Actinoplanes philippinensis]GIE74368.1 hypothetical protein Aph02nite_03180 [Actinoplanes philippinensis]SFE77475.1 hypothetical protein SAMN05421541_103512 [Actinoplanes philippinensis]
MPLTWDGLDEPFRRTDSAALTALLLDTTEQERLAFAGEVERRVRSGSGEWWARSYSPAGLFALLVIACVPTAARAAALLQRRGMRSWRDIVAGDFLRIIRARRLPWAGDLGVRLARGLPRDAWGDDWRFVETLLLEGDADPPVTEGVVHGWVEAVREHSWSVPLTDALRGSPWLDLLLPSVFEIDGLGSELPSADFDNRETSFPAAIARLVAEGRLERRAIVDATTGRLARGDRPGALRPFTLLHEALAPTPDELSRHTGSYARLAGDAPSPVARLALAALRTLGEQGRLEISSVIEAGDGLLARKEKVLVKAALSWLDEIARRSPEHAGEILATVAAAFDHQSLDIQERAIAVATRHLAYAPADVAARVVASGRPDPLPQDVDRPGVPAPASSPDRPEPALLVGLPRPATLRERPEPAAHSGPPRSATPRERPEPAAHSGPPRSATPRERPEPAAQPGPPRSATPRVQPGPEPMGRSGRWPATERSAPAAMPVGIGSAVELAEEVAALIQDPAAVRWERILAALVTLPSEGFTVALAPVLDRHPGVFSDRWGRFPFLGEVIAARIGRERSHIMRERLRNAVRRDLIGTGSTRSLVGTPSGILTLRVAEAAWQVVPAPVPVLLATPTDVTGSIDAGVLVDRLARYEEAGADPWQLDLQQAMVRVSRDVDPEVLARAETMTSPSGKVVAGWLRAGGMPDPVSSRFEQHSRDSAGQVVGRRVVAALESGRAGGDRIVLEDALVDITLRSRPEYYVNTGFQADVLAMVLPHHREAVAAWALTDLAALADQDGRDASLLPLIADLSGPIGPATTLALAYGLAARHEADRIAAVDAFLGFAAGPEPFAAALGAELGDLAADGTIKLARVAPALRDAHQAGASAVVWQVLRAALPPLLPVLPRGLPDLLELGTRAASAVGAHDTVPGLAAVAARGGGTRLVREAKRLLATLTR